MNIIGILNKDGGTLKHTDPVEASNSIQEAFQDNGHRISMKIVSGDDLIPAIEQAAKTRSADTLMIGGGDGSVSAAAAACWKFEKTLIALPLGTMNLFARSIGVPLDPVKAYVDLSGGRVKTVDIATANDHPFVHQVSVGLHPSVVKARDEMEFHSRYQKIYSSLKAVATTLFTPPDFRAHLEIEGVEEVYRLSALTVSNNPFGVGHIPYADQLDAGKLGLYVTQRLSPLQAMIAMRDTFLGRMRQNTDIQERTADRIVAKFPGMHKKIDHMVVDGELLKLESQIEFRIHPKQLNVLVPRPMAK